MTKKEGKLSKLTIKYLLAVLLVLTLIVATFTYLNQNASSVQAQVAAQDLNISNAAPPIGGGWQDFDREGNGYELWKYVATDKTAIDYEGLGEDHDETKTIQRYYEEICDKQKITYDINGDIDEIIDYKDVCANNHNAGNREGNLSQDIYTPFKRQGLFTPNQVLNTKSLPLSGSQVLNQTPFLVVGDDGQAGGPGSLGFYDPTLELDLWVPKGFNIANISFSHKDLCPPGSIYDQTDSTDRSGPQGVDIYIKGDKRRELIFDSSSSCSWTSTSSSEIGDPFEEASILGSMYEKYVLIAEMDHFDRDHPVSGVVELNQFQISVAHPLDSFLVAPATRGTGDNDIENINTLNISNRIPYDDYKNLQILWHAEIFAAPNPKDGCSYKDNKYIGLYDSDYPGNAQAWMRDKYPPKIDIYSVDRNEYIENPALVSFTKETTLEFNGIARKSEGERIPSGKSDGSSVAQNAWEDKLYEFKGDKIYKFHYYNLDQRSWIQIRMPFNQINALQKCIYKPLFKVYYSDISVGGRFGMGERLDACREDKSVLSGIDADLYAHANKINTDSSSAEYAARVYGVIDGFYSNFKPPPDNTPPPSYKERTFANNDSNNIWGGHFGEPARCMPNYWRGAKSLNQETVDTLDLGTSDPDVLKNNDEKLYKTTSPGVKFELTNSANSRAITDLQLKTTLYIEGDLVIRDNILNNDSVTWDKLNEIGFIYIIVKGNIYIDPSVTQIDAALIAYTDSATPNADKSAGRIHTCYVEAAVGINLEDKEKPTPIDLQESINYADTCENKLVINGALIGHDIHLGRTFDETIDPIDNIGEEINLLPEYFVGTPQLPEFGEWIYSSDSVVILPPNF